jgi:antitoxin component YwqK of YwqJK toxin-antitoxin module
MQISKSAVYIVCIMLLVVTGLSTGIKDMKPPPIPYLFSPPTVVFKGGDGSSISNAVIITGATSTSLGITCEKNWIWDHLGYTHMQQQSLVNKDGRTYDVNTYTRGTNCFTVAFDITDFFGKNGPIGKWVCHFADGSTTNGNIMFANDTPWKPLVSNRTATVHYQTEDACNNGLVVIAPYKNGKINGIFKCWRRKDGIWFDEYKDDKQNGFSYGWYSNGQPWIEAQFTNGIRTGISRRWHKNGQLAYEISYKDGRPDFEDGHKSWHENGAIASQRFRLPQTNGWLIVLYYPDGKPEEIIYEYNGKSKGLSLELYENGNPKHIDNCYPDQQDCMSINWYANGQKKQEWFSVTNTTMVTREWSTNGVLLAEGFKQDNKNWNGSFRGYWKDKNKIIHYKEGHIVKKEPIPIAEK